MEKVRVKRMADSIWLVQRALRLQAGAIQGARVEALIKLLMPNYGNFQDTDKRNRIAIQYFAGSDDDQRKAVRIVEKLGITADMIEAFALELQGPTVMALDKMRARCEHSIDQAEKKLTSLTRSKKAKTKAVLEGAIVDGEGGQYGSGPSRAKDSWN